MLIFSDVTFKYSGDLHPALSKVSFSVAPGQRLAILGANGSGKSTLARLATGLLEPDSGKVIITNEVDSAQTKESFTGIKTGEDVDKNALATKSAQDALASSDKPHTLTRLASLVMQDPDLQIVTTSIADEIAFGPMNLGYSHEEAHSYVAELLSAVGLSCKADDNPNTLSGGERQRLVIAAALAMRPQYLVLDEPTAMLDDICAKLVRDSLLAQQQAGCGILLITHDFTEALTAERVLVLNSGCVMFFGKPEELIAISEADSDWLMRQGIKMSAGVFERLSRKKAKPADSCEATRHTKFLTEVRTKVQTDAQADNQIDEIGGIGSFSENSSSKPPQSLLFENVSYTYKSDSDRIVGIPMPTIKTVSFSLQKGTTTLLFGPSGSGKSTLLKLAAGLLEPDTGKILLAGQLPKPGATALSLQNPEDQLFASTVLEDVAFGPRALGLVSNQKEATAKAMTALIQTGLDPAVFGNCSPFSLSGGEARRAALAGVLAMQPKLLLLDEPTSGLDARGCEQILYLLRECADAGMIILVASHHLELFEPWVDQRLNLVDGALTCK